MCEIQPGKLIQEYLHMCRDVGVKGSRTSSTDPLVLLPSQSLRIVVTSQLFLQEISNI